MTRWRRRGRWSPRLTRCVDAARGAIASPLLETTIEGAKGVLLNITGGPDLSLFEVTDAASIVAEACDDDANIIFGAVIDEAMKDQVRVTVIATGFRSGSPRSPMDDFDIRTFTPDSLEIPKFLRRDTDRDPRRG